MRRMPLKTKTDAAAWLAVLIDARERNDFSVAANARTQLELAGVKVTFASGRSKARKRAGLETASGGTNAA